MKPPLRFSPREGLSFSATAASKNIFLIVLPTFIFYFTSDPF